MSEYHAHHILPGVMSHISIRSSFVEDNLVAKAARNECVDGHMTACDDDIGRRTTTQQPTNKRWRGGGGSSGGGSAAAVHSATEAAWWQQRGSYGGVGSAKAQRWRQLGGGEVVVEAQQRCGGGSVSGGGGGAQVAARWLRCAVEQIWVLWLHDLLVGRWCSLSERGKQSPKTNLQRHINRRAAQISTGTVHQRIMNFMYILTDTL